MTTIYNYSMDTQRWIKIIFITCLISEFLLVLFDYLFNYLNVFDELYIRRIWNIARENSIPTWFASTQTQLLGVTVIITGFVQKRAIPKWQFLSWLFFGLFYLWIGIDDAAEIHEKLGTALNNMFGTAKESELLIAQSYSWQFYIAPVFATVGLFLVVFFGRLFHREGLFWYLFFGLGCWVFAQLIDFTEGLDGIKEIYNQISLVIHAQDDYLVPHTSKVIEEYTEMLGTTLLWVGYLKYLAIQAHQRSITFDNGQSSQTI